MLYFIMGNKIAKALEEGFVINRIREFIENEARSCSMGFGCVTPLYVYRMWGGIVPLNEIEATMKVIKI